MVKHLQNDPGTLLPPIEVAELEAGKSRVPVVLYVDDDEQAIRTLVRHVRYEPWELVIATSGKEALELLESGQYHLDVAILDLSMPEMDGFELLTALRKINPNLPIMILTGRIEDENFQKAVELQCDRFVEKPYYGGVLLVAIRSLLPMSHRTEIAECKVVRQKGIVTKRCKHELTVVF